MGNFSRQDLMVSTCTIFYLKTKMCTKALSFVVDQPTIYNIVRLASCQFMYKPALKFAIFGDVFFQFSILKLIIKHIFNSSVTKAIVCTNLCYCNYKFPLFLLKE